MKEQKNKGNQSSQLLSDSNILEKENMKLNLEISQLAKEQSRAKLQIFELKEIQQKNEDEISNLQNRINLIQTRESDYFIIENQLKQQLDKIETSKVYYEALLLKKSIENEEAQSHKDKQIQELKNKLELINKKIENIDMLEKTIAELEDKNNTLMNQIQENEEKANKSLKANEINYKFKLEEFKSRIETKLKQNYKINNKLNEDYIDGNYKLMLLQNQKLSIENSYLYQQIGNLFKEIDSLKKDNTDLKESLSIQKRIIELRSSNDNKNDSRVDTSKDHDNIENKTKLGNDNDICKFCSYIKKAKDKNIFYLNTEFDKQKELSTKLSKSYNDIKNSYASYINKYSFLMTKVEQSMKEFLNGNNLFLDTSLQSLQELFRTMEDYKKQELIESIIKPLVSLSIPSKLSNSQTFTTEQSIPYNKKNQLTSDVKKLIKLSSSLPQVKQRASFMNSNINSLKFNI